ncbi:DNA polymerase III subunit gamma/tau [Cupriavidus plantarum]|uniref:DNA polymerase III subunit gamma/tau n=2 Tax=Cupriavidus plantarum TaxID=942865 RepID=UPI0024039F3C|nr:DNA polymerase III subunit gamma/tau [Cupriavidus plantarum]SMR66007.1 DNA polymerase III, gamma subunit /DNA polymerase III, tau subunit [Cupriavidus plantarum]
MSYQVLARKWRPRDFTTLVGQEHVVRALTHALEQQRLHHAYLFTGTRGVGKTTLSRILAKALNCTGVDGGGGITAEPCGQCKACQEIDSGRFVDYIEMDAASNRGVDEMAQLLDKAVYAPTVGRFKVYMIDEVHMLTNHAFNAMLKTLEEPPGHVKFILATTDPQKIPVTVLSRCLQFNLKQMPPGHIVSHLDHILAQEGITHDGNALRLLAQAAHGSMRDALSLTDQAIAYSAGQVSEDAVRGMLGAIDQSYLVQLLDALAAEDGATLIGIADSMADRSLSFAGALQDLGSLLHKVALAQAVPASVQDEWPEAGEVRRLAGLFDAQEVQLFYQIANIGRNELALAPDEYAGFTMTLLRMLAFRPSSSTTPAPVAGQGGGNQTARPRAASVPAGAAAAPATRAAEAAAARGAAGSGASRPQAGQVDGASAPGNASGIASSIGSGIAPAAGSTGDAADRSPDAPVTGSAGAYHAEPVPAAEPAPVEASPAGHAADAAMSPARAALLAARQATAGRGGRPAAPMAATAKPAAPSARPAAQPLRPPSANRPAAAVAPAPAESAPVQSERPQRPASADERAKDSATGRAGDNLPQRARADDGPSDSARGNSQRTQRHDAVPPWEMAGGSDVPPWEEMPADLPLIGPYDSDPGYDASMMFDAQDPAPSAAPSSRAPQPRGAQARPQQAGIGTQGRGPHSGGGSQDAAPARPAAPSQPQAPAVRPAPVPPAADADGTPPVFTGTAADWPALAASLPLRGLAQQLAYQSELARVVGRTVYLRVPVAAIAENGVADRMQQVLSEHFGADVRVQCEIGPVFETAAAADAQARAERQREAEANIEGDPFVQGLLREFGGQIVPGSIQPRAA